MLVIVMSKKREVLLKLEQELKGLQQQANTLADQVEAVKSKKKEK